MGPKLHSLDVSQPADIHNRSSCFSSFFLSILSLELSGEPSAKPIRLGLSYRARGGYVSLTCPRETRQGTRVVFPLQRREHSSSISG